jgi:antirestriction protein ArdC
LPGWEAHAIPFSEVHRFNAAQCEGLPEEIAAVAPPPPPGLIEPTVEALIRATGIDFRIGGNRAFYVPSQDFVMVPPPQAYHEPINWHRTALHEMGHATGIRCALPGDFSAASHEEIRFRGAVGRDYGGLLLAPRSASSTVRHCDYIGSWLEVLPRGQPRHRAAASQRGKAATGCSASCRTTADAEDADDADMGAVEIDRRAAHDPPDRRKQRARPPGQCRATMAPTMCRRETLQPGSAKGALAGDRAG